LGRFAERSRKGDDLAWCGEANGEGVRSVAERSGG
jgi:hypothetical protein